jgi:hypothetical protein
MATKKTFIILVVFLIGSISLYAQRSRVDSALSQFERDYPEYAGKAYVSDEDRSWQDQMRIIMERPGSYSNISRRFTQEFGISLPTSQSMTSKMLDWWEREIMAQAGNGFAHVGGKAVDVSVRYLNSQGTQLLASVLQKNGLSVLYEQNDRYERSYFVGTLLLHCY